MNRECVKKKKKKKKKNCTGAHSILMDIIEKQTAIFAKVPENHSGLI